MTKTARTWMVNGKPTTLAEFRAELDAAKKVADARFARDWGGLSVRDAVQVAVDNAHLFKPVRGRS